MDEKEKLRSLGKESEERWRQPNIPMSRKSRMSSIVEGDNEMPLLRFWTADSSKATTYQPEE